jgi:transcriptional regulator with XRE-family HTH domain
MGELWSLLSRFIDRRGLSVAQLARLTAVDHSQLVRIRDGKLRRIEADTLRKLHGGTGEPPATGTGIPLVELIVASGMWTAEELDVEVVHREPATLSNEELLGLVAERMRRGPDPAGDGELDEYEQPEHLQRGASRDTGRRLPHVVRHDDVSDYRSDDGARGRVRGGL